MMNVELKEKIVDIVCKAWSDPVPCTAERKFEHVADALIAAGIGDTSDLRAKCESLARSEKLSISAAELAFEHLERAELCLDVFDIALMDCCTDYVTAVYGYDKERVQKLYNDYLDRAFQDMADDSEDEA